MFSVRQLNDGRTRCACRSKSRTAGESAAADPASAVGTASGDTGYSCSVAKCSGRRDVAKIATVVGLAHQPVHDLRRLGDLLKIVEHHEHPTAGQVRDDILRLAVVAEPDRVGDAPQTSPSSTTDARPTK